MLASQRVFLAYDSEMVLDASGDPEPAKAQPKPGPAHHYVINKQIGASHQWKHFNAAGARIPYSESQMVLSAVPEMTPNP